MNLQMGELAKIKEVSRMTVNQYKSKISKAMKVLGTYKEQYENTVELLAKMLFDYENAETAFDQSGGNFVIEYTNKAGATNMVKNPHWVVIENLRSDILIYSRELGLTPAGLKKMQVKAGDEGKKSALAAALEMLEK